MKTFVSGSRERRDDDVFAIEKVSEPKQDFFPL
jgi:hypothetical protein